MKKWNNCLILLLIIVMAFVSCQINEKQVLLLMLEINEKVPMDDYKTALDILEKRIKKNNRGYWYYFYHGIITGQQGIHRYASAALEDYLKAYEFNPNTYEINERIGHAYIYLGEYEQAILYLERSYELYLPESGAPFPYWGLAEAYLHVGRLEEALEMNAKSVEIDGFPEDYLQRGIILSQSGDVDALTENYEIAISIDPKDGFTRNNYALRLIEMGYTEKAYQFYANWLKENDNHEDSCYAGMGYILMLSGEWEKSIDMLEKANSIDKPDILTWLYMSFYYFFNGDYYKAFEYEARYRLQFEPSGEVYWRTSLVDFLEGYKKNWQFQKLMQNTMNN